MVGFGAVESSDVGWGGWGEDQLGIWATGGWYWASYPWNRRKQVCLRANINLLALRSSYVWNRAFLCVWYLAIWWHWMIGGEANTRLQVLHESTRIEEKRGVCWFCDYIMCFATCSNTLCSDMV